MRNVTNKELKKEDLDCKEFKTMEEMLQHDRVNFVTHRCIAGTLFGYFKKGGKINDKN